MKKLYFLLLTLLTTSFAFGQSVFINEIHYDNTGTDSNEGVEIAGIAGTDVTGYQIIPYNGYGGVTYTPVGTFSGTIPDQQNGYGTLWVAISVLQNGAPDGIALVDNNGTVIQFLSYEGTFTATNGAANGMTSVDIGVLEDGTNAVDTSLQLFGTGDTYAEFTWQTVSTATRGAINNGQTFTSVNAPTLTITSPTDGTIFNPEITTVDVSFSVQNFTVANGTGDGHIQYTVDGGSVQSKYDTDAINVTGLSSGSHTVYMELVDNAAQVLSPAVNASVTFEIATYTTVANLAELRASVLNGYYQVTGEVVATFAQTLYNQKWGQDSTAGIMIHDPNGVVTTVYNLGDGISGAKGQLTAYNQLLEFIPTADFGTPTSTGNVITPEVVTLADLNTNVTAYESELVKIMQVTVSDLASGGDGTFLVSQNYPITDASGSGIFRTQFTQADYIGQTLPTAAVDAVCIVGNYNGTAQVTPRSLADITLKAGGIVNIDGFSMYPNPAKNQLTIRTADNLTKNVQIFNVLGKQVLAKTMSGNTLDINLPTGIYVVKVEEAGKIATQKLMVQ